LHPDNTAHKVTAAKITRADALLPQIDAFQQVFIKVSLRKMEADYPLGITERGRGYSLKWKSLRSPMIK
jgi:hypothetical protein